MGVRGLATLVDDNKDDLLHDHKLHDTRVIIDASNLYHFLYYHYSIPTQYAGDYDVYARKCRHFFNTLRQCDVEPFIVLDGGYDPDDRKLPAVLDRMESRRLRAGMICMKGRGCVLPVLCYTTFQQVLVELNIQHVSSTYEADREIAVLANRWKAPVLSNDSDFFIYGIQGGYIPLDYINMTVCVYNKVTEEAKVLEASYIPSEDERVYLPVKYYHYRTFVERFRKSDSEFILPLFATLNGNDYLNPTVLSQFFAQLHVPKNPSKKAFNLKAHTHMLALLYWLDNMDTEANALQHVFEHLPKKKGDSIKEQVTRIFNDYRYIEKFAGIEMDMFLEKKMLKEPVDDLVPDLKDFNQNPLPKWFVEILRSCSTSSSFLQNITVTHRAIFSCQIEKLREPSTYACSRYLRSVLYGAVISENEMKQGENSTRKNSIEEYDREFKNTRKIYVQPVFKIEYGSRTLRIPSLIEMSAVSSKDRKLMVLGSLQLMPEFVTECPDEPFLVLIGVMSFWISNANPKVTESHLNALIIGVMMLHVRALRWLQSKGKIELGLEKVGHELIKTVSEAIEAQDSGKVDKFVKHMEKHLVKPDQCSRSTRESEVIHGFSQFQACYLDTLHLNQAFMSPLHLSNPAVLINSTFLYNLCRDFDTRPKPDSYVAEILSPESPLHKVFVSWKETVMSLCKRKQTEHFMSKTGRVKSSSRKKKGKAKKQKVEKQRSVSDDTENSDSESNNGYQDLNNKFALLGMDD